MNYTEKQLDESLQHIAKLEGYNWFRIEPHQRARCLESVLAMMMSRLVTEHIIDVDSDTYLLASAYQDYHNNSYFNFKENGENNE